MNVDTELESWREQWRIETSVPLDLRKRVERQSRLMRIGLIAEILVTIAIGGFTTVWAVRSPQPDIVLLAVVTWLFFAAAWTFSITLNRGAWSPSALDTAAFVNLSVRRLRRRLAAIRFAAGLFMIEAVFCLSWVYNHSVEPRKPVLTWLFFSSLPMDFVWLSTVALFGALIWYRRKNRAELSYLLNLYREVAEPASEASKKQQTKSSIAPRRLRRGKGKREA